MEVFKKLLVGGNIVFVGDNGTIKNERGSNLYTNHVIRYDRVQIKGRYYYIHRLVAMAFLPNPNNYETVNHIDENKRNNSVSNLEWCSQKENNRCYTRNHIQNPVLPQKVIQYDLNDNLIAEYDDFCQASRATGINRNAIRYCAIGRNKTSGGFKWGIV